MPAKLKIVNTDHQRRGETLRVFGPVRNIGGLPARNVRIRITILDTLEREMEWGESAIYPPTIDPYGVASFEVSMDKVDSFSSLNAEVFWSE